MWPSRRRPQFGIFVRQQVEQLRSAGVEIDVLFVDGSRTRLGYLTGPPRLLARLRNGSYDLIHAHYVFSGVIARAQWGVPIVLTHHGIEVMEGWQSPLCFATSRIVDAVIVTSSAMRDRLALPDIAVIPCGVDLAVFRPVARAQARRALSLPADGKFVVFVGERRPEKRFDLARQAAEHAGLPLLHVAGEPPQRVAMFMNAADALVLASDNEGSPQVVKEALACNLPVVSTAVGAVPELIGDIDGCHLAAQTASDLGAKLRLAVDGDRCRGGRARVAPLALAKVSERVLDVYDRVLEAHAA